ncbi:hypothetical protein SDC9_180277 [bioreactor metagenome]|uniref:Uncharacterized protein n=1 Tax=bioreactor metagenome TaxID=1076179 RepID=A0A645H1A1_9ZZZZ
MKGRGIPARTERDQQLPQELAGDGGGRPALVIYRGELDHVRAYDVQFARPKESALQLEIPHAARFRRSGARKYRRIEHVEIDRQVDGLALKARDGLVEPR